MASKTQVTGDPRSPKRVEAARKLPEFVPGKLIIHFKPDALQAAIPAAARGARSVRSALPEQVSGPLDLIRRECGIRRIDPLLVPPKEARSMARSAKSGRSIASLAASVEHSPRERLGGYSVIETETAHVPENVIKRMNESGAVRFVERVANRWTAATRAKADPSLNLQWGLRIIDWFAIKRKPDASHVHVAILDTGVDTAHPDLKHVVVAYHRNGHSAKDLPGHGTHVAGILAAKTNNGIGISGVANCKLHVWKIFADPADSSHAEKFDDEAYNQALAAVLDSPARILNLSISGTAFSQIEKDLIDTLVAEGVLVVAAMGNEYEEGNPKEWPAAFANVVGVGAIGENRRRASFSNTGRHINIMAPGNNILSTLPRYAFGDRAETDYDAWPGTSMAAPHVAGCAALLMARFPNRDGNWIAERLQKTAVKLPSMGGRSFTSTYGYGLINILKALS